MEITCNSCGAKFKLADDKLPTDKRASFACPKCQQRITVEPAKKPAKTEDDVQDAFQEFGFEEDDESSGESRSDPSDKPFDFIEEEGSVALVCESDPEIKKRVIEVLELLEYHVTEAVDHREALRKIRYQDFNAVVLDERFGTKNPDANGLLVYLERLPMNTRRNIFVALISDRFRSMDHMMAFSKSVNVIINKKDMADIDKILAHSIQNWEMFYRIFKENLP